MFHQQTFITKKNIYIKTKQKLFVHKKINKSHKKSKCDKTQKLNILQNSKIHNMIKHKNYKLDKTQNMTEPKM